jgi:hypothetical protein
MSFNSVRYLIKKSIVVGRNVVRTINSQQLRVVDDRFHKVPTFSHAIKFDASSRITNGMDDELTQSLSHRF